MIKRLRAEMPKHDEAKGAKRAANARAKKEAQMAAGRRWAETEASLDQLQKLRTCLNTAMRQSDWLSYLNPPDKTTGITRDFLQGAYDYWEGLLGRLASKSKELIRILRKVCAK